MKKFLVLLFSIIFLFSITACGGTDDNTENQAGNENSSSPTYQWKFALDETQNSNQDMMAQIFKKIVEEKSNGAIQLDIYYLGQLGDGDDQGELIQNGAIDIGMIATGATGTMVPESNIFGLHYIFPNDLTEAKEFLRNSEVINGPIAEAFDTKNMHVIGWLDEGFMQWTNSKHPINSPADFKGLKIRVMGAPIITETYKAYGASPASIPFSELYSSLSLNMIDGQTNPYEIIENMKFYEVQKYCSEGNSDLYVAPVVINKDLWESLPEEIQNILLESMQESYALYDEQHFAAIDSAKQALEDYGVEINIVPEEGIQEFQKLARQADSEYYAIGGDSAEQLLADFLAEAEQYK
jgi:C4-dicarboxylate-binding protein DctP